MATTKQDVMRLSIIVRIYHIFLLSLLSKTGDNKMEEWARYGNYMVSNKGKVKTLNRHPPRLVNLHTTKKGYSRYTFHINKKPVSIYIHCLVWDLFNEGSRDNLQVDHIDENKQNNSIDNLQLLTHRDNNIKMRKANKHKCTSKFIGVSWEHNGWVAKRMISKKQVYLGRFKTEEEAYKTYIEAGQ